jgi:hypothetical protein
VGGGGTHRLIEYPIKWRSFFHNPSICGISRVILTSLYKYRSKKVVCSGLRHNAVCVGVGGGCQATLLLNYCVKKSYDSFVLDQIFTYMHTHFDKIYDNS